MPSISIPIFTFSSLFIGNYGASAVLTPVTDLRTNGAGFKEDFPTTYVRVLDSHIQSSNHTFDVTLSFLSDSVIVGAVALGRSITTTSQSSPPGNQQYAMLLVDPYGTDSFYFPKLSTIKTRATEYKKNAPVTTDVTFRAENRDPNVVLAYQDTLTNLISVMGSRSPY